MIALVNKGVLRLTPPPITPLLRRAASLAMRAAAHGAAEALATAARACGVDQQQAQQQQAHQMYVQEQQHATQHHASRCGFGVLHHGYGGLTGAHSPSSPPAMRTSVPVLGRMLQSASQRLHAAAGGGGLGGRGGYRMLSGGAGAMSKGRSSAGGLLAGRKPLLTKTLEWNLRWCVRVCLMNGCRVQCRAVVGNS